MRVNNKGFTLIELIVVIAIMVIILILALPQVSKIQEANKDRKYEAYKESIRAGSKLHIDSYAKDLFGNNNSGCIRIKYSELKQNNLIKDFGNKDIFCGKDAETFVEVRKVLSEYKYKVNIVCRNIESNKVEWKDEEITGGVDSCSINPDRDGPEIKIKPSSTNNKWYNSKDLNIKIQVSDVSGLNTNTSIIYNWYNKTTGTQYKDNSQNYKNKKGVEKVSFTIPNSKMPSDSGGKYKLTVKPDTSKGYGVQDVLGNVRVTGEEAEEYWIDNEGPKFNNTKVSSTTESYNSKKVIFEMDATDNFTPESDLKVYISNSGYQKGGSWKNYSSQISWTLTGNYDGKSRTIYVSIKDLAGNITEKKFTYTIYKECQSKNITTTSTTGRCSGSCGTGKAVKTYSVKDKYNNASCDGDGETEIVSCNTGIDCCSRTTHKPGSSWTNSGSCSANCGGGKQRQTRPLVSSYDSSVSCGTDSREVSCNTRSCCSSTKHKPGSSWTNSGSCSASCGPGKQTQTRPLVSNYDSSVSCGNDTRTVDCNLGACDTTAPACPTITASVKPNVWTNKNITFTMKFSSDTVKYKWYTRVKRKENTWDALIDHGYNNVSTTKQTVSTEGINIVRVDVYDAAGNVRTCGKDSSGSYPQYKIDKTPPYTPYVNTSLKKTIDGKSVSVNVYGNCDRACYNAGAGRSYSVTLQNNKTECITHWRCNGYAKKTTGIRCTYAKHYACGGSTLTYADNQSNSYYVSGINRLETRMAEDYNCVNSGGVGDYSVNVYYLVDNAGNISPNLRMSILNVFSYEPTKRAYEIVNYEWKLKKNCGRPSKFTNACHTKTCF